MRAERDVLGKPNFTLATMPPGTYYWRTRARAASGQESNWSEPWKFTVIKREIGQTIEASDWRVESIGGDIYLIGGKTQPGMVVRAQGRETFAAGDGSFNLQISA